MFKHTYTFPSDENIPIWRYMPFSKFVDIINTSTLFFSRMDKFRDKFEGHVNQHTLSLIDQLFEEEEERDHLRTQLKHLMTNLKTVTYVSCWHMNHKESSRMWRQYSLKGEGVAIKSNCHRLMQSIQDNTLGPMHLRPIMYASSFEEEIDLTHAFNLLNYKQPKFKFEKELRLLLLYAKGTQDFTSTEEYAEIPIDFPEFGVNVFIDIKALVESVYVSPNSPTWFFKLVKDCVDLTLQRPVFESTLK